MVLQRVRLLFPDYIRGQAYDMNVFASVMNNTSTNSETVYSFKGENNGNASLNPTKTREILQRSKE